MHTDDRSLQARIAFSVVLLLSLLSVAALVYPLRSPLFLAAVTGAALSEWHERLARRLGSPANPRRVTAAIVLLLGLVCLVLVPLSLLTTFALSEGVAGANYVREELASGGLKQLADTLPSPLDGWVEHLLMLVPSSIEQLVVVGENGGGRLAAAAVGGALSAGTRLAMSTGVMLLATYAMLLDGRRFVDWLARVSPLSESATAALLREFHKVSRSVLGSTVAVAGVQALAATVGFFIAQVPHALFFGLATFFAAFIPGIGTAIVATPLAVVLWLQGHPVRSLIVMAWTLLVVSMIDSLLKPILMKGGMGMPGLVVFFALFGGLLVFGPLGIIAGPLAVTFFVTMVRLGRRELGAAPVILTGVGDDSASSPRPESASSILPGA